MFGQLPATKDFVQRAETCEATLLQLNAHAGVAIGKPYKTKRESQ